AHKQTQKLQAAPFATGKVGDGSPLLFLREPELLHELAGREFLAAHAEGALLAFDDLDHAKVGHVIEFLDVLAEHRRDNSLAALDLAGARRDLAVKEPQEGGLSGTVDAHQPQPLSRSQAQGDVVEEL